MSTTPLSRRGFTLIELLTVIAIIGILAAIIIPTVGRVRESARTAACASNLRQIAMGVLAFAVDNQDRLPTSTSSTNMNRGVWSPGAMEVVYSDQEAVAASIQLSVHIANYIGDRGSDSIWVCPSNSAAQAASSAANPNRRITYILNHNRTGGMVPIRPFGTNGVPVRLSQIRSAGSASPWNEMTELSQIWMISDADSFNYGTFSGFPSSGANDRILPPHNGARNYAFFDGRVATFRAPDWPANPGGVP